VELSNVDLGKDLAEMTRSPAQLVTEFCELWASPDPDKMAAFFAEDAVYHNIPMQAVHGREAIKQFITGFTADYSGIDFAVHRQISDGNVVMNERTDTLRRKDGVSVELPVMGVFEIVDDHIAAWRDYFDVAMFTKGLG
jgi:limonene-1,2-epoxide hydrolase